MSEQIYNEYLRRAKVDYDKVDKKIRNCFENIKSESQYPYELESKIKDCSYEEIQDFHNQWFFSTAKELVDTKWFYLAAKDTYDMYISLIKLPRELSDSFYLSK